MIELGEYRHYKGGEYEVIANGLLENTGEPAVFIRLCMIIPNHRFGFVPNQTF